MAERIQDRKRTSNVTMNDVTPIYSAAQNDSFGTLLINIYNLFLSTLKSMPQTIGQIWTFTSKPVVPDKSFGVSKLDMTGTASSSYFARGDGAWAAVPQTSLIKTAVVACLFSDLPVKTLFNLPAKATMFRIRSLIEVPFNGTSPVLTIGDATDPIKYCDNDDIIMTDASGTTCTINCIKRSSASVTPVNAYLTASGSTAGQLRIICEYIIG